MNKMPIEGNNETLVLRMVEIFNSTMTKENDRNFYIVPNWD